MCIRDRSLTALTARLISLCHCPQNTTAGRVWLYTLLHGNSLYRLYATAIHRPLIVPARPSRYTAYTAIQLYSYTAIQLYTLYSIQHYTASLRRPPDGQARSPVLGCAGLRALGKPRRRGGTSRLPTYGTSLARRAGAPTQKTSSCLPRARRRAAPHRATIWLNPL